VNLKKEQKGDALLVHLSGDIGESADFEGQIGPPPKQIHVWCRDVGRIVSAGVKSWIKYFGAASAQGTKIRFFECSTTIVEQLNMIRNFDCGGTVESIQVPFVCTGCKSPVSALFKTEELRDFRTRMPSPKCPRCGGVTQFDDIIDEYFVFVEKKHLTSASAGA
jgi:hypothetical protein